MTDIREPAEAIAVGEVSIARLHGLACWDCGAVTRRLEPSARISDEGTGREWTVARCSSCRNAVPA